MQYEELKKRHERRANTYTYTPTHSQIHKPENPRHSRTPSGQFLPAQWRFKQNKTKQNKKHLKVVVLFFTHHVTWFFSSILKCWALSIFLNVIFIILNFNTNSSALFSLHTMVSLSRFSLDCLPQLFRHPFPQDPAPVIVFSLQAVIIISMCWRLSTVHIIHHLSPRIIYPLAWLSFSLGCSVKYYIIASQL